MHRVNPKKNRAVVLRITAYATIIILSVITTALLLFIALGYRFNRDGSVIQSGLLLVDNKPEAAQIYIDGELEDASSPGRFVLPVGAYELSLELDGYRGWKRQFTVLPQSVEQVRYPLLIPEVISTEALVDLPKPQTITQSENNEQLIYHTAGEGNLRQILLDPVLPEQRELLLPPVVPRENSSLGTIEFIDWSLNDEHVLARQTLPSGRTALLAIHTGAPQESVNITALFPSAPPSNIRFVDDETQIIYGLHEGILRRYNLRDQSSEVVLERVLDYSAYGDDLVAFSRVSEDTTEIEVGLQRSETVAVLEKFTDTNARPVLTYAEYDDDAYLLVASTDQENTRVYRNPLTRPILKKQIPYVLLPLEDVQIIKFSPNNQYVFLRSGQKVLTYDFENTRATTIQIEEKLSGPVTWMNGSHLAYQTDGLQNHLLDFDGNYNHPIVTSDAGARLFYSPDSRNAYRLISNPETTVLERVPLVVTE